MGRGASAAKLGRVAPGVGLAAIHPQTNCPWHRNGVAFITGALVPASARGTVYTGRVHAVDIMPTILGRVPGATPPAGMDGIDIWPALFETHGTNARTSGSSSAAAAAAGREIVLNIDTAQDGVTVGTHHTVRSTSNVRARVLGRLDALNVHVPRLF